MKRLMIINVFLMLVFLASGLFEFWQEADIIDANNRVAVGEKCMPIHLKGVVYFVSKKQITQYNITLYTLFISFILNAFLIGIRNIKKNKNIDWDKHWEKQREWLRYWKQK